MENRREAYEEKLDAQLKEFNAQLVLLRARAGKAKAEAKIEYCKLIEALQQKQDEAGAKLRNLKTAGDDAWEDLKSATEKAWGEIRTAFHEAAVKFK
jgi:hypothetical protein